MPINLSLLNVIDLESSCWEESSCAESPRSAEPIHGALPQEAEIIEVGVCVVRLLPIAEPEMHLKRSILIRPTISTISEFCTHLTGHTQEELEGHGMAFPEALALLRTTYDSRNRVWASWGDYDRRMFEQQCARMRQPYPFTPRHLNVKTLYALATGQVEEWGMKEALEHIGMDLVGRHHNGADDACNIARLLCVLLGRMRGYAYEADGNNLL